MAIEIEELWNYRDPDASEARFLAARADANGFGRFILDTQIARCFGLRGDFPAAQSRLQALDLAEADAEGEVRYWLEWGRTLCSARHDPEAVSTEDREAAGESYLRAIDLGRAAGLSMLVVDALHMMTVIDTSPADQVRWNEETLAFMLASDQATIVRWEGSLRNNLGYAFQSQGQFDAALAQYELSREAYLRKGDPVAARIANWMIARVMRDQGRLHEALAIQLSLAKELDQSGSKDPYIDEEIEILRQLISQTS